MYTECMRIIWKFLVYCFVFLLVLIVLAFVAYFYVINKVSDVRVNFDNLEKIG